MQKRAKTCKNVHLKYLCLKKRAPQGLIYQKTCKNVQKRAKTCKNVQKGAKTCKSVHLKYSFIKKTCKKRAKMCKIVQKRASQIVQKRTSQIFLDPI